MEYGILQCTTNTNVIKLPTTKIDASTAIYISYIDPENVDNFSLNFMEVPYTIDDANENAVIIARPPCPFVWLNTTRVEDVSSLNSIKLKFNKHFFYLYDITTGLIHIISSIKKSPEFWGYGHNFKNIKGNKYYNPLVYGVLDEKFTNIEEAFKKTWFYEGKTFKNLGVITSWKKRCGIYEYVRQLLDKANFKYTILTHLDSTPEEMVIPCFKYDDISLLKRAIQDNKIDNVWIHYSNSWFSDTTFTDLLKWLRVNNIRYVVFAHSEIKTQHIDLVGQYVSGNAKHTHYIPIAPVNYNNRQKVDYFAIGTFGFMQPHKNFEAVFDFLVKHKKYHYYIYSSFSDHAFDIGNKYKARLLINAQQLGIQDRVHIFNEYLPENVLLDKLAKCGVVTVCYQDIPNENQSAVIALLRATGRPVVSSDSPKLAPFADNFSGNITLALEETFANIKQFEKKANFKKRVYTKDIELFKHMYHIKPYGDLSISWRGDMHGVTSFSVVNAAYMKILDQWGAIQNYVPDTVDFNIDDQPEYLARAIRVKTNSSMIKTGLHFPPLLGTCNVPILAWEIDKVPQTWINSVGKDCIKMVAISNFTKEAFVRSGFDENSIVVNPLGISIFDIDYSKKNIYEVSNILENDSSCRPFTFLDICWCEPRKGTDILLDAYTSEFTTKDNVVLVIKTSTRNLWLDDLLAHFKAKRPNSANILILEGKTKSLDNFYKSADVFVHPHRGEGFGLPILEAAGFGVPSITTGWAGPIDFTDDSNSWHIKYKLIKSEYHHTVEGARWAQPSVRHLGKLMRYAYNHPEVVREKGINAFINSFNYTWERSAFNLASILYEVQACLKEQ